MPTPTYLTMEDVHQTGVLVLSALILTSPQRVAVDYSTLDTVDRERLDILVQANGGTLPLTSVDVAKNTMLDNGRSWYDTYLFTTIEFDPSSGGGTDPGTDPGTGGTSGVMGNGVFILNVAPNGPGIVGQKTYKTSAPASTVLSTAVSDTTTVLVTVGAAGPADRYMPAVTVNGQAVLLTESSTKRWFTGTVSLTLTGPSATITATDGEGCTDVATVTIAGAGPAIQSVVFGAYPGSQTSLKLGDVVDVTITADAAATAAHVRTGGASASSVSLNRVGTTNVFVGTVTIGALSGSQTITAYAQNDLGTAGADFESTTLLLDQTTPTISSIVLTYPNTQTALKSGETVTAVATITNATSVSYSGANLSVPNATTYEASKIISHTLTGYNTTTYTIVATNAANNATATRSATIQVATTNPTATISIQGNPSRLVSSPVGINYTVVITPSQVGSSVPTLAASHGTWSGSWTQAGNAWTRTLVVSDATARGTGTFTALSFTGPSGLPGTTISGGGTYTVGGLTLRTLTYAAFSRVAAIGAAIGDVSKTSAQYTGGSALTRYTDNAVHVQGFYPANSDGSYNATGTYLGLSDTAFVGSNTTGTLQVDFQEAE